MAWPHYSNEVASVRKFHRPHPSPNSYKSKKLLKKWKLRPIQSLKAKPWNSMLKKGSRDEK